MKNIFSMTLVTGILAMNSAFAGSVPNLSKANGLKGVGHSSAWKSSGVPCEIEVTTVMNPKQPEATVQRLSINGDFKGLTNGSSLYLTDYNGDGQFEDNVTSGRRACGDLGGVFGYKQSLSVSGRSFTITESFRCALDGLKKTTIDYTCEVK